MYIVPESYWNNTWNASRVIEIKVLIHGTDNGSATLTNEQISTFSIDDAISSDDKLEIGSAYIRTFDFSFFDELKSVRSIGLGGASADVSFIVDGDEIFYSRFYIDEVYENDNIVSCKCVDAMAKMDSEYVSDASFPTTLYVLAQSVCESVGLTLVNSTLQNGNLEILSKPEKLTCRQIIQYISQIAGGYAKIKRGVGDNLEIIYYDATQKIVPNSGVFKIERASHPVTITGISYKDQTVGTSDYVLSLAENPLLTGYEGTEIITQILNSILNLYQGFSYYPAIVIMNSCFAFDSGDIINFTQRDGTSFQTIISHIIINNLSTQRVRGAGETVEQNKYVSQGKITTRISELLQNISKIENVELPELSQAIIEASETLTTAITGYVYIPKPEDPYGLDTGQIFIIETDNPLEANRVWRINLNGFGYSSNGINGPYEIAITMDGKINASFITTGILSANVMRTGLLSSQDGKTWINLDDGTFNLGGKVSFDGENFNVSSYYSGGSNLLYGTAAFDLENWTKTGTVSADRSTTDISSNTESGGAFKITNGTLSQTVKTIQNGQYCWMLRYKVTGTTVSDATVNVMGRDYDLDTLNAWTMATGNFIAGSDQCMITVSNSSGTLLVADLVIMPGLEVSAWQQTPNEIMSDELYFANGKLGVGKAGEPLRTAVTNNEFSVENTDTGEKVIYAGVGGAELDQTTVHKSLKVNPPNKTSKALAILPQGDGHVYFVVND